MKLKILGFGVLATLGLSQMANAQSASANFNANAQINAAITLTNSSPLNFGNLIPVTGGTVVISAGGVRSVTGAVVGAGGWVSAASFSVTGSPATTYSITLPPTANIVGPGDPMSVRFAAAQVTDGTLTRTLSGVGADGFAVGGTLTVGNAQAPGNYSGVFAMTVAY